MQKRGCGAAERHKWQLHWNYNNNYYNYLLNGSLPGGVVFGFTFFPLFVCFLFVYFVERKLLAKEDRNEEEVEVFCFIFWVLYKNNFY